MKNESNKFHLKVKTEQNSEKIRFAMLIAIKMQTKERKEKTANMQKYVQLQKVCFIAKIDNIAAIISPTWPQGKRIKKLGRFINVAILQYCSKTVWLFGERRW